MADIIICVCGSATIVLDFWSRCQGKGGERTERESEIKRRKIFLSLSVMKNQEESKTPKTDWGLGKVERIKEGCAARKRGEKKKKRKEERLRTASMYCICPFACVGKVGNHAPPPSQVVGGLPYNPPSAVRPPRKHRRHQRQKHSIS